MSWLCAQVEDVTDDGRVVTKLVKKGKDYKRPNEGATVKIAYTGRIGGPDGPLFEEHTLENPLEFVTDEGERVMLLLAGRPEMHCKDELEAHEE